MPSKDLSAYVDYVSYILQIKRNRISRPTLVGEKCFLAQIQVPKNYDMEVCRMCMQASINLQLPKVPKCDEEALGSSYDLTLTSNRSFTLTIPKYVTGLVQVILVDTAPQEVNYE